MKKHDDEEKKKSKKAYHRNPEQWARTAENVTRRRARHALLHPSDEDSKTAWKKNPPRWGR
jgi:hypothetical protein